MGRVTGLGGLFFRADDPGGLAAWYDRHLGISVVPQDYAGRVWHQEAGPTVFAPFPRDTAYFGRAEQAFMINLRVEGLDTLVASLRKARIEVDVNEETYPNGRFARLHDPEGNPIELWEPD